MIELEYNINIYYQSQLSQDELRVILFKIALLKLEIELKELNNKIESLWRDLDGFER